MSEIFFRELRLKKPDYHLGVGSGHQGSQTGEIMKRLEKVLMEVKPEIVITYGDTNSTLAGTLAAVKLHIPVGHIEAGVRSYNRYMPEEINRVIVDQVANFHFCPSMTAVNNLSREGVRKHVFFVGDVMYDSVRWNQKNAISKHILETLKLEPRSYIVATIHRAENTDIKERLVSIFKALDKVARGGLTVLVPIHPRTWKRLQKVRLRIDYLRMVEPVSYLNMLKLQMDARAIITDSGGMQKEAFYLRVPCITLRNDSEWVETIETGWNRLAGWKEREIIDALESTRCKPSRTRHVYGNGHAAEKILKIILQTR